MFIFQVLQNNSCPQWKDQTLLQGTSASVVTHSKKLGSHTFLLTTVIEKPQGI